MRLGIHLPHAGEQATPALIRRFAIRAEELGIDDVWVSEHIIVPRDQFPRSPMFYDPVTFRARHILAVIEGMTMTPMPISPIPIWFGGSSDAALRRTARLGEGWHGSRETPEQAGAIVARLRAERPGEDFTVSMRVMWDGKDQGTLRAMVDAYADVGVQHVMVAPVDRNVDDWDAVLGGVGRLVG